MQAATTAFVHHGHDDSDSKKKSAKGVRCPQTAVTIQQQLTTHMPCQHRSTTPDIPSLAWQQMAIADVKRPGELCGLAWEPL